MNDYIVVKNPDREERIRIRNSVKANGGYCPSRPYKAEETKCPCEKYRKYNLCVCGFFIKVPCKEVAEGA